MGFPDASVPFALKPPVAMAVSPKTVTFTLASASALFITHYSAICSRLIDLRPRNKYSDSQKLEETQ